MVCVCSILLCAHIYTYVVVYQTREGAGSRSGPCVSIDKTDGITVYLSEESRDSCVVTTSKSSEMNISFPVAGTEDWVRCDLCVRLSVSLLLAHAISCQVELPIPEQFVHHLKNGKLTTDVSELYS